MNNQQIQQKTGLTFRRAYFQMMAGKHIKRPSWVGYWAYEKSKRGDFSIIMHTLEGDTIDIRDTLNIPYTFSSIVENDWMVVDDDENGETA